MLQQTLDKLEQTKLLGMAQALKEQAAQPEIASLSFEERLQILVDRESDLRDNRKYLGGCKKPNSSNRRVWKT